MAFRVILSLLCCFFVVLNSSKVNAVRVKRGAVISSLFGPAFNMGGGNAGGCYKEDCKPGFEESGSCERDGRITCVDIDECSRGTHNCDVHAVCTNTEGSFTCECNDGFVGDEVIGEIVGEFCYEPIEEGGCAEQKCKPGFELNGDCPGVVRCDKDIDECERGTHNCDPIKETCQNTVGSFKCECEFGKRFYSDGRESCRDPWCRKERCQAGFEHRNDCPGWIKKCDKDIDECKRGTDNCDVNADCHNTVGSYTCECNNGFIGDGVIGEVYGEFCHKPLKEGERVEQECKPGFELNGDGPGAIRCDKDIDECERETHDCDARLSRCYNNVGSFKCSCKFGTTYSGGRSVCREPECRKESCTGSRLGFEHSDVCSGTFWHCDKDIDECERGTHNCAVNAACYNTVGSFKCECNDGFYGNGVTCDVLVPVTCNPDSEDEDTDDCHSDATCTDRQVCECRQGFVGDGNTCDRGECVREYEDTTRNDCHRDAYCTSEGTCKCGSKYWGDGKTCEGKPAEQSETYNDWDAGKAVDGDTNGYFIRNSCTHTKFPKPGEDAWWSVDMGDTYCVGRVVIYNRKDDRRNELSGAVVRVGSDVCGTVTDDMIEKSDKIEVTCALRGRYLSVHLPNQYLQLCEVQAFKNFGENACGAQPRCKLFVNKLGSLLCPCDDGLIKDGEACEPDRESLTNLTKMESKTMGESEVENNKKKETTEKKQKQGKNEKKAKKINKGNNGKKGRGSKNGKKEQKGKKGKNNS